MRNERGQSVVNSRPTSHAKLYTSPQQDRYGCLPARIKHKVRWHLANQLLVIRRPNLGFLYVLEKDGLQLLNLAEGDVRFVQQLIYTLSVVLWDVVQLSEIFLLAQMSVNRRT